MGKRKGLIDIIILYRKNSYFFEPAFFFVNYVPYDDADRINIGQCHQNRENAAEILQESGKSREYIYIDIDYTIETHHT